MNDLTSLQNQNEAHRPGILKRAMVFLPWVRRHETPGSDGLGSGLSSSPIPSDHPTASLEKPARSETNDTPRKSIDYDAMADRLRTDARGLTDICRSTEADFLGLGSQLNEIHNEARQLTQMVVAMLSTDEGQNIQGALKDIQLHAADANRELKNRGDILSEDMLGLQTVRDDLSKLITHNRSFKQVAKNIKMIGLNISIESARSQESKAHFQSLAEEIVHLAQTVNTVAGKISDDTNNAMGNMDKIQAEINQRMNHLGELIGSAEQSVQQALQDVDELLQITMGVMDSIGAKAAEITEHVGHLVVSIQIHDNISQRVAHIDTVIEEAVHMIQTSSALNLPETALNAVLGKIYGMVRLQIAQLSTIIEDVEAVQNKCAAALEKLQEVVKEVAQPKGFTFSENGDASQLDTTDYQHPVMLLKDALSQLTSLFDEGLTDIQLLTDARQETSGTIGQMNQHIGKVRDINFEIHLKALNAVVKSTRLGETGRSIEVLVNEMKELAERSNTTIDSVTEVMRKITSASQQMDENVRHESAMASAEQHLRNGIKNFSEGCANFKQNSKEALDAGHSIQNKIIQTEQRLEFFNQILSVSRHHLNDLQQIAELLQPYAEDAPDDWKKEEQNILARYTMQREREAHAQIRHGHASGQNVPLVNSKKEGFASFESSSDGLDDSIELF